MKTITARELSEKPAWFFFNHTFITKDRERVTAVGKNMVYFRKMEFGQSGPQQSTTDMTKEFRIFPK